MVFHVANSFFFLLNTYHIINNLRCQLDLGIQIDGNRKLPQLYFYLFYCVLALSAAFSCCAFISHCIPFCTSATRWQTLCSCYNIIVKHTQRGTLSVHECNSKEPQAWNRSYLNLLLQSNKHLLPLCILMKLFEKWQSS